MTGNLPALLTLCLQGGNLVRVNPTNTIQTRADLASFLTDWIHLVMLHGISHLQASVRGEEARACMLK